MLLLCWGGGSDEPDARYNYELTTDTSFVGASGFTNFPGDGKMYVFASITLSNDKVEDGIYLNQYDWRVSVSGIEYDHCFDSYDHPQQPSGMTLKKGEKHSFVVVFEVPNTVSISDAKLIYDLFLKEVEYDSTL